MLGIVQGYAQLTVRSIGGISTGVAVRNRRSRNRDKGESRQDNQPSTKARMVHSERFREIIVCVLAIVKMISAL